ncbi:MAG: polyamine ABC transporter substrate-binding protein [Proteobacteria bacterium]|nr:polyamine ABC transporter substrate-binding protein [Pseudomonadota bacterium]
MSRFLVFALLLIAGSASAQGVVNIYNWSDYIAEDTIAKFEEKTGIKVNYDVFDTNELLEAKLLAGSSGYDVVVPTGNFLERQIQAGVFRKLDRSKLSNLANMDADIMRIVEQHDSANAHSVVYMWGTTGFAYNTKAIQERMPEAPVSSWAMVFEPEIVSQFEDCGVAILESPTDILASAKHYLGLDPASESADDLKQAEDLLMSVRQYIRYFHPSQYINDLANGDICLAVGYSGDLLQSRDRAAEANNGVEIEYVIPEEGGVVWFDLMAIPADAPNVDEAHQFINFIMDAQIAADITNYVFYANANAASTELVDSEVTSDQGIYPSDEVKAGLFAMKAFSSRYDRIMNRTWTRIKTGQ